MHGSAGDLREIQTLCSPRASTTNAPTHECGGTSAPTPPHVPTSIVAAGASGISPVRKSTSSCRTWTSFKYTLHVFELENCLQLNGLQSLEVGLGNSLQACRRLTFRLAARLLLPSCGVKTDRQTPSYFEYDWTWIVPLQSDATAASRARWCIHCCCLGGRCATRRIREQCPLRDIDSTAKTIGIQRQ